MTGWEIAVVSAGTGITASGLIGGSIWKLASTIERLTRMFESSQLMCKERHETLDEDRQERCVWIQNVEQKVDSHIKWHAQGDN